MPLVIAGPGIPRGVKRGQLCYLYDINPTLCGISGLKVPTTVEFKSLMTVIKDDAAKHRYHPYNAFLSWQRSVRDTRHKLIEYCAGGGRHTRLFELAADPDERHNLADDPAQAGTLVRLSKLLELKRIRLNDGTSPHPFSRKLGEDFWSACHASVGGN